jgi:hypothetical protein
VGKILIECPMDRFTDGMNVRWTDVLFVQS